MTSSSQVVFVVADRFEQHFGLLLRVETSSSLTTRKLAIIRPVAGVMLGSGICVTASEGENEMYKACWGRERMHAFWSSSGLHASRPEPSSRPSARVDCHDMCVAETGQFTQVPGHLWLLKIAYCSWQGIWAWTPHLVTSLTPLEQIL